MAGERRAVRRRNGCGTVRIVDTDLRRVAVNAATYAVTVTVNVAAVVLPLNGLGTAEISDRFPALVVPADYVFSIWSVIYLALGAWVVVQTLPGKRRDPLLRRVGTLPALTGVLNAAWVVLWHYEVFALTVPVMVALLLTLIAIHLRLREGDGLGQRSLETAILIGPWSLYLGWITVATIANVSQTLMWLGFEGGGIPQPIWAVAVLVAGVAIAVAMLLRERDVVFAAVVVWAYAGIVVRQAAFPEVVLAACLGAMAVAGLAFWVIVRQRPRSRGPKPLPV